MQLKYPDTFLLVVTGVVYLTVATILIRLLGRYGVAASLLVAMLVVMALLLHLHRVREQQDADQLRQIQALIALHRLIPFEAVSPWMTGWAATPEFAATLYQIVRDRKPDTVLELGSGASSVIVAAALKQNGKGRLMCLDQDESFAERTREHLARNGLSEYADVVFAPITNTSLDGEQWLWYDPDSVPSNVTIDVLIVDGPNRELQKMARYPALPLLIDRLAPNAVVVLDDADRKDERRVVRRWASEYAEMEATFLDSAKGTAMLTRKDSGR